MAFDETLAHRVRSLIGRRKGFREKKMFGGVGFLLNGNMCVGIWKDSLVVRFDRRLHEATMSEPDVRPFDITGRAMKGWALIEPVGIEDDQNLQRWLELSVGFVKTLPAKS